MKLVGICAAPKEQEKIGHYCQFAVKNQVVPLAVEHLFMEGDEGSLSQESKREMSCEVLSRCDELWIFGSPISSAMKEIIRMGMGLKKPMLYFNQRCELLLDIIGLKGGF